MRSTGGGGCAPTRRPGTAERRGCASALPRRARRGRADCTGLFAASTSGDTAALRTLLAENAVLRSDGGGKVWPSSTPSPDWTALLRMFEGVRRKWGQGWAQILKPVWIDGLPGYISRERGDVLQTTALAIEDGRITAIYNHSQSRQAPPRRAGARGGTGPHLAATVIRQRATQVTLPDISLSSVPRPLQAEGNNRQGRGQPPLGLRSTVGSRRGAYRSRVLPDRKRISGNPPNAVVDLCSAALTAEKRTFPGPQRVGSSHARSSVRGIMWGDRMPHRPLTSVSQGWEVEAKVAVDPA